MTAHDAHFRPLGPEHFDAAHAIVIEVTDWLNAKGIRQWPRPIPADIYRGRHDRGENHGVFIGDRLAAVLSLSTTIPDRWPGLAPPETFRWLGTMAVTRTVHRTGLGVETLHAAEDHLRNQGVAAIYLDCVEGNGFLPRFYTQNGYRRLDTREMRPGLTMHLFQKQLQAQTSPRI